MDEFLHERVKELQEIRDMLDGLRQLAEKPSVTTDRLRRAIKDTQERVLLMLNKAEEEYEAF